MRVISALFILMVFTMPVKAASLDDYVWKNRVLLVFNDAPLRKQSAIISDAQNGFKERDFVIINAGSDDADYARFNIDADAFTVILIGKDGGVKARWDAPVQANDVFSIVDAMPMRQREMREHQ